MKPLREHVAIAIDGGGIRGTIVARALGILEDHLGRPCHDIFRLAAGTSTGSIVSAGIGCGLSGQGLHRLYTQLGSVVFRKSWRSRLWPLTRYRYPSEPLAAALRQHLGAGRKMGDFWTARPQTDVVITAFDLHDNHTRLIKPWKSEYADWPVVKAVLASSTVPTYFPAVEGRYVDGGVGSYCNPCYLAAYELAHCLKWEPAETTLISLGTGREPQKAAADASRFWAWQWVGPILGSFLQSADDQQVHLVRTFFRDLDFRRFQVDLKEPIATDDPAQIPLLTTYGEELGRKILNDETDWALGTEPTLAPGVA